MTGPVHGPPGGQPPHQGLSQQRLFLIAGLAAQHREQAELTRHATLVAAYVARGLTLEEATRVVNAWSLVRNPPRWFPLVWWLSALWWVYVSAVAIQAHGAGTLFFWMPLALGSVLRARYCARMNAYLPAELAAAREVLRRHGERL